MAPRRFVNLPRSERVLPRGAQRLANVGADEEFVVTVYVRSRPGGSPLPDPEDIAERGEQLDDESFNNAYGADPDDIAQVVAFAAEHDLEVVEASPEKRSVLLRGVAKEITAAFGVKVRQYTLDGRVFRGREGPVRVAAELADVVEAVFGLDERQVGYPRLRRNVPIGRADIGTVRATGLPTFTYLPPMVADAYRFPAGTSGAGQSIAIMCFNEPDGHGGYSREALTTFFEQVLGVPVPEIVDVVVHGQGNDPGVDDGSDPMDTSAEVMLDIQMAGGCAPRAKLVVYFTQFTEQGWVDALNAIIADAEHQPSIISISYGNPEDDPRGAWTAAAIDKVNEAFRAAAAKGITVCCASGADGSREEGSGVGAHADFPASSPYVLGCGGTRLIATNGTILDEVVWNDGPGSASGGGVSRLFPLPRYQQHADVPLSANADHRRGRGVPDVSGVADPRTGVVVISLDGLHLSVIGGTSATAPMWCALIARLNEALGRRLGFVNPDLYAMLPLAVLRDITQGDNGAYPARVGWDACSGLGSPDGVNLLMAFDALAQLRRLRPPPWAMRFVDASQAVAEALRNAWDEARATATTVAGITDDFEARTRDVLAEYVERLKHEWASLDAAGLDATGLFEIGRSISAAAAEAGSAVSTVTRGHSVPENARGG